MCECVLCTHLWLLEKWKMNKGTELLSAITQRGYNTRSSSGGGGDGGSNSIQLKASLIKSSLEWRNRSRLNVNRKCSNACWHCYCARCARMGLGEMGFFLLLLDEKRKPKRIAGIHSFRNRSIVRAFAFHLPSGFKYQILLCSVIDFRNRSSTALWFSEHHRFHSVLCQDFFRFNLKALNFNRWL